MTNWMDAKCIGMNTDVFYELMPLYDSTLAKAVCYKCPIRKDCLDYAITNHEIYGIWGGMTANERKRYRSTNFRGSKMAISTGGRTRYRQIS